MLEFNSYHDTETPKDKAVRKEPQGTSFTLDKSMKCCNFSVTFLQLTRERQTKHAPSIVDAARFH